MRVTDQHMLNQYIGNNNLTLSAYMRRQNRVLTQKDFLRASENSVAANAAMKIRKQMSNIEMYDENLKNASNLFTIAETNLYEVAGNIYNTINTKLISIQSTKGPVEYEAIGEEIKQQAEEMIKVMNADCGDRQLFGGTSSNKQPFKVKYYKCEPDGEFKYYQTSSPITDENGRRLYNYFNEDGIMANDVGGNPIQIYEDGGKYYDTKGNLLENVDSTDVVPATEFVFEKEQEKTAAGNPVFTHTDAGTGDVTRYYQKDGKTYDMNGAEITDTAITGDLQPSMVNKLDSYGQPIPIEAPKDEDGNYIGAKDTEIKKYEAGVEDTLKSMRAIVYYNGDDVSAYNNSTKYKGSDGIYIDIGIGIKYTDNGDVIPATAMDISLNGAKLIGCGIDNTDDGFNDSNNIIQLAFDAARAAYNAGDTSTHGMENCNRLIDKLSAAQKTVLSSITELGVKQNSIDFHITKDTDYMLNISEQQNDIEGVDLTSEITNFTAAQAAYNAALRISQTAVPQSIFDYI